MPECDNGSQPVLKTGVSKEIGGSNPSSGANNMEVIMKLFSNRSWIWILAILTLAISITFTILAVIESPWILKRIVLLISIIGEILFVLLMMVKPTSTEIIAVICDSMVTGILLVLMICSITNSIKTGLISMYLPSQIALFGGELIGVIKIAIKGLGNKE